MVLVYSERNELAYELLCKGRELADKLDKKVVSLVIGEDKSIADDMIAHGADTVVVAKPPVSDFKAEEYADILKQVVDEKMIENILIGSSKNGR